MDYVSSIPNVFHLNFVDHFYESGFKCILNSKKYIFFVLFAKISNIQCPIQVEEKKWLEEID